MIFRLLQLRSDFIVTNTPCAVIVIYNFILAIESQIVQKWPKQKLVSKV